MKAKIKRSKRTKKKKKSGRRATNRDNAKRAFEDLLVEDDEFLEGYLSLLGRKRGKLTGKGD